MSKVKLPPVTQEPIYHVDGTPDANYAIQILEAYVRNNNCHWEVHGLEENEARIYIVMNETCVERVKLLKQAIAVLEQGGGVPRELFTAALTALRDRHRCPGEVFSDAPLWCNGRGCGAVKDLKLGQIGKREECDACWLEACEKAALTEAAGDARIEDS